MTPARVGIRELNNQKQLDLKSLVQDLSEWRIFTLRPGSGAKNQLADISISALAASLITILS